jgi:hypothetical protein
MTKETTIKEIGEMLEHVVKHMATKDDLKDLATKNQIVGLRTQVTAIETDVRGMKHAKLETRVADLEDEVFGAHRSKHPKHVPL